MCGIMGYIGDKNATEILVEGLRHLEYRGYDSAGVAVLNGGPVELRRSTGKLNALEELLKNKPVNGTVGIGHTRWATHGSPTEENAHPHACCKSKIFVVHNGIIENYDELREMLLAKGHLFKSQTDTEVLAHVIEEQYQGDLLQAVRSALTLVRGSYALGVVSEEHRDQFVAARKDSPLIIGIGDKEMFVASDVGAILRYTRKVIFLEEGDIADISRDEIHIFDQNGLPAIRLPQTIEWDANKVLKSGYKHFMLKEIHEQPETIQNTALGRISLSEGQVNLEKSLPLHIARSISKVCLIGCGTSYHAGLVARFWFEELAHIPCEVEIASEYRYLRANKDPNTLVVTISQSGETADTLAALRKSRNMGLATLALCNAIGSTAARDAEFSLITQCGPEIGVASTKAFTGQLTALFLLSLYIGQSRGAISAPDSKELLMELVRLPLLIRRIVDGAGDIEKVAQAIYQSPNFIYLGRHLNYPVALEGALKLKEISYIHAEGFSAGEMKHGPIALVDEKMPVVAIVTQSFVREKMLSNIQEVKARGGIVIAIANEKDRDVEKKSDHVLWVPETNEWLAPFLNTIPTQILAYHVALLRGCDVDQPRNLAKSVTVE